MKVVQLTLTMGGGVGRVVINAEKRMKKQGIEFERYVVHDLKEVIPIVFRNRKNTIISHVSFLNMRVIVAAILCFCRDVTLVEHTSPFSEIAATSPRREIYLFMMNVAVLLGIKVRCVSQEMCEDLNKYLILKRAEKSFSPLLEEIIPRQQRGKNTIIFVSRDHYQKNNELFFEIANELCERSDKLRFLVVGLKKQKFSLLTTHPERFDFVENTPHIFEEMDKADLLILTSRYEGYGNVIIEGLSRGIPFVSFAIKTGPKEIAAETGSGLCVRVGDKAAMVSAILGNYNGQEIPFNVKKTKGFLEKHLI